MSADWSHVLLVLLISPAVGSFLGVLVDRLPEGRSILGRSRCTNCGTPLRWRDMIPVLSTLWLRGCCATCGATIPGHLLRIELGSIAVALAAILTATGTAHLWALALCFWCLVALFYTDLQVMRLPDPLTLALFVFAMAAAWADPARNLAEAFLSGLGTAFVFWALRAGYRWVRGREGLGLGDVKLAAGFGALLGWTSVPTGLLIAAGLALAVALVERSRGASTLSGGDALPFGSYLCGAALLLSIL